MAENNNEDIYEILGVDPNKTSKGSYNAASESRAMNEEDYLNGPSGSIFDDYSKYPKDPDNYWWHFRLWTYLGIGVVALFIIAGIADAVMSSDFFTKSGEMEEGAIAEYTEEVVAEELVISNDSPYEPMYFSGTINDKYEIHMYLDLDSRSGKYYYVRSGSSNCMELQIKEIMEFDDQTIITMEEYNPAGDLCGEWRGTITEGTFTGHGEFLGKIMPFELTQCEGYKTDF